MIPEDALDAAAKALYFYLDEDHRGAPDPWESLAGDDEAKIDAKETARLALEAAAPHILAPRTISTIDELNELPKDSIVLDVYGVANQLSVEWVTEGSPERTWDTTGHDCNTYVALPATVLWVPSP